MRILRVDLYGAPLGELKGDDRRFDFAFSPEAFGTFGPNSTVLSVAIPMAPRLPQHHARRRQNWFTELLPEGQFRDYLSAQAGINPQDSLSLLALYGLDVAGAVRIWDPSDEGRTVAPEEIPVTGKEIREFAEQPMRWPLGNSASLGKTSLAGVQPKILLSHHNGQWNRIIGGAPSSHLVKPMLPAPRDHAIADEEYGLELGRAAGLVTYESWREDFDGLSALVIERYDRIDGERIHQEDFNQVLGASGAEKYQEYGGRVSLARIAQALTTNAPAHELQELARLVTFAVAIGNLDLHAKNISLLHPKEGPIRLAPAYDCSPLAHRSDTDGRMAMSIDGEYRFEALTRTHLVNEMLSWGLRQPDDLIQSVLEPLEEALSSDPPAHTHPVLHDFIRATMARLRG